MHPFFHLFGLAIPAFGAMIVIAGAVSYGLLLVLMRKNRHVNRVDAIHFFLLAVGGGLLGAWVLHMMLNLPRALSQWAALREDMSMLETLEVMFVSLSGTVFYGGLLGGVAAMCWYAKRYKIPALPYTDLFAPIILVAHSIGRVGCFLAGCCYGIHASDGHVFAVVYPPESLGAPSGTPILATPLIEAAANMLILCGIIVLYRCRKRVTGEITAFYLVAYSVARFVLEFFRGDGARGFYLGVSTSHWISVFLLIAGIGLWMYVKHKKIRRIEVWHEE